MKRLLLASAGALVGFSIVKIVQHRQKLMQAIQKDIWERTQRIPVKTRKVRGIEPDEDFD